MSLLTNTSQNQLFKNIKKVHNKSKSKGLNVYLQANHLHSWWSRIIVGERGVWVTHWFFKTFPNNINQEVTPFKGIIKRYDIAKQCLTLLLPITSSEMIQMHRHDSMLTEVFGMFKTQLQYKVLPTKSGLSVFFSNWWNHSVDVVANDLLQNVEQEKQERNYQWLISSISDREEKKENSWKIT